MSVLELLKAAGQTVIVAADVQTPAELFQLLTTVGPWVGMVKLHWDTLKWSDDDVARLLQLKQCFNFFVLEDRKYNDISSTVAAQHDRLPQGYADFVTVHYTASAEVYRVLGSRCRGVFVVTDMSNEALSAKKVARRKAALPPSCVIVGHITQHPHTSNTSVLMPGVHPVSSGEADQQYRTPYQARCAGADFIIVGRAVHQASSPVDALKAIQGSFEQPCYRRQLAEGVLGVRQNSGRWALQRSSMLLVNVYRSLFQSNKSWIIGHACHYRDGKLVRDAVSNQVAYRDDLLFLEESDYETLDRACVLLQ